MHPTRWRVILPLVVGCASALLMIWDLHNNSVIESMAFVWDTGPPVWPYEASWMAFVAINAPAQVLCLPFFYLFDLRTAPARYPLLFPVAVFWWWWLGRRIDFGLLPTGAHRHRRWTAAASLISAPAGESVAHCSTKSRISSVHLCARCGPRGRGRRPTMPFCAKAVSVT